ncbi:MAG: metallophosphoesterase [Pseudomonadota bacterium]|nr:metallophosphoesterase [Pseudomonadota bacterium]
MNAPQVTVPQGYDLVGDVHGCAQTLRALLERLGYVRKRGVYQHPTRQLILTGDVIDRGPRIRETLHLVRDMVDAGSALMILGNHEYDAICFCTEAKPGSGRTHLREHNERTELSIRATLEQFANHPGEWREFLDWMLELPLFLEFPKFRVVHACWDHSLIRQFRRTYGRNRLDSYSLHQSIEPHTVPGRTVRRVLRGIDLPLPKGHSIQGQDGVERTQFRVKFWGRDLDTYGDLVFQPDRLPESIANAAIAKEHRMRLLHYGAGERPLFFGHYWRFGDPELVRPNMACLDYSAVKSGKLVCYRMDGEQTLNSSKFVWEDVGPETLA